MLLLIAVPLLMLRVDCPVEAPNGPMLPLSLNLPGQSGQAYVSVPMAPPATTCRDAPPPPADVLRGEPGDLLRGPGGKPHVDVRQIR